VAVLIVSTVELHWLGWLGRRASGYAENMDSWTLHWK